MLDTRCPESEAGPGGGREYVPHWVPEYLLRKTCNGHVLWLFLAPELPYHIGTATPGVHMVCTHPSSQRQAPRVVTTGFTPDVVLVANVSALQMVPWLLHAARQCVLQLREEGRVREGMAERMTVDMRLCVIPSNGLDAGSNARTHSRHG